MRDFSNFRVLIIDDDRDDAASLSALLERRGYAVETAVDAAGAGEALGRFAAEAALIDLRLGGGDALGGLDLIPDLRRRQPDMVCVMVTAFAELDTVVEALRAGADDFLTKPIDPPLLFAALERCMARRKRLRESEQRFRDFSDATSDWFWEMDENLRFSYFSDRFSDITGVTAESLLGKTHQETGIPDADPEVWESHLADLAAHRSFRDFQHKRTFSNDRQVYLSINGKAIFNDGGNFLGYRGAGSVITERKRAEEALKQAHDKLEQHVDERTRELIDASTLFVQEIADRTKAEDALHESEARYREIFDESPVGIWVSDWSAVKRSIDDLAKRGVTDWRGYFTEHPDRLAEAYDLVDLVDVSRAVLKLYGIADTASLAKMYRADAVSEGILEGFLDALLSFLGGTMKSLYEAREHRADGAGIITRNILAVPVNHYHDWSRVIYSVEDITERKRAEKEREESAQRLEDITDAASDWFWEMDADLRFTYISDRYEEIAGISADHFFGRRMDETYPRSVKRYPEVWKPYFEAVAARRNFRGFVHDDIRMDGLRRVISSTGKAIFDEDGAFAGYRGTSTDITEQRLAEEELRDSEARLSEASRLAKLGFYLWDVATDRFIYCSEEYARMHGLTPEEFIACASKSEEANSHTHPDDRDAYRLAMTELRGGKQIEGEWRVVTPSGETRYLHKIARPILDDEGVVIQEYGVAQDITERRAAEEAIRTRDAWLRGIMENTPIQIILQDIEGRIMAVSRNVAARAGLKREDYIGRTTADFLPADIAEIYMNADREVMRTGRLVQQEVVEKFPDGSPRHMLSAKFPLKDDKGNVLGVCSLATDITEMKQVQAQLHQAQKMEAVGQLTSGIAHDFNNLLAIVMGNLELIEDEIEGNDSLSDYLHAAFSAADDAATLTQRLLAFSRNQPLMPKTVDINGLVGKMIVLVGRTLDDAIDIKSSFADDLAPVSIDSGQLENALLNLVVNARDAMPKGGEIFIETNSVTIDEATGDNDLAPGDYISLTVRDTGVGMAPDVLEHVFEPFFTTKEVGEGSGLGLSMVFGFVNQSGGQVTIDSERGRGTTVTLYLPATTVEISEEEKPDPDLDVQGDGKTILFVEDNELVCRVVVAQLTGMGFKVHHAHDGKSALDALEQLPLIDLLLTDVKMPGGMDGAELALEARRRRPSLPVLFASGYSADALMNSGHLEDNAQLIEKPFKRHALAARIASILS